MPVQPVLMTNCATGSWSSTVGIGVSVNIVEAVSVPEAENVSVNEKE